MMMLEEVVPIVTQFGAAGLIGVLWIVERRHAVTRDRQLDEAHRAITQLHTEAESLLTVVKENTRAITALEGSQRQLVRLLETLSPEQRAAG
jgi:hypothetical protein